MPCSSALKPLAMAGVLMMACQAASALGWARAQQSAVLGQPLDFSAALRLDPGDTVAPECVVADVQVGDQRWQPGAVRVHVDAGQPDALVMRVTSANVVDEPVVAVTLLIGCPTRMSRRFVLLADPPGMPSQAAVTSLVQAELVGAAKAAPAAPTAASAATQAAAPTATALLVAQGRSAEVRKPLPSLTAPTGARAVPTPAPKPSAPKPAAKPKPDAGVPGGGRLKLDLAEPSPRAVSPTAAAASAVAAALEAVAEAASAARAAATSASEAQARVDTLEKTVTDLRAEAKASNELVAQMRTRLAMAEGEGRWMLPLLFAVAALAGVAGWLAWKLRSLQGERQASWRRAAVAAEAVRPPVATSMLPMVTSEIMQPSGVAAAAVGREWASSVPSAGEGQRAQPERTPETAGDTVSAVSPVVGAVTYAPYPHLQAPRVSAVVPAPTSSAVVDARAAVERTLVLPPQATPQGPQAAAPGDAKRDVSIEELLDLEQQAEFFIVLGQEDAAIDLLVDHLRDTGGGSPLPYLKLLEIYRRRGDHGAYERTRTRFNHRFNAYAPDWDADLMHGRSLDDYPGVLPRIQQAWSRPLDAMAELEALLFRKSRGELFDLPAYREVLFLYSLSRDLLDREAADSGNVDLLLPLASDGTDFGTTASNPYFGLERDSVFDAMHDDRPTVPVDLDLTQPDMPLSIMDPLAPRR